ncbi:MAG: AzlC family ABC transporter permease [Pseudomonadota bacterium]
MSVISEEVPRSQWWAGAKEAFPILPTIVPFAAVFGALAVERGLTLGQIMFASGTIYAGASQYAMLDLMGQGVAPWLIVATVFAINFRHILYSAAMGRTLGAFGHFQRYLAFGMMVDPQFAVTMARSRKEPIRPSFYFGYAVFVYITWMTSNLLGALFGRLLEDPSRFGFDLILPLYFIGLIMGFRSSATFVPVLVVSVVGALGVYYTLGSPWHITLGGLCGLVVAAVLSKPPLEGEVEAKEERADGV